MQDAEEGNLGAERNAVLASVEDADNSSVGSMIKKAKDMMEAVEFAEQKFVLADSMIEKFNLYNNKMNELNGLANMVVRQEITKQTALGTIDEIIERNDKAFEVIKKFYTKEPAQSAYNGIIFLLGDNFNNNLDDDNITTVMQEASDGELQVILRVHPEIAARQEIHLLEEQYQDQMRLYAEIKNQRTEQEDTKK